MDEEKNNWIPEWLQRFVAGTPGGRAQEVMVPGSVPYSPVGKPKPPAYGINYLRQQAGGLGDWINKSILNAADATSRFVSGRPGAPIGEGLGDRAYSTVPRRSGVGELRTSWDPNMPAWTGQVDFPRADSPYYIPGAEETYRAETQARLDAKRAAEEAAQEQPTTDWLAQAMAILGGGPDYGAYRQALTDQAASLNAQIQAMYNQLGEQAGANVARLQDIYGGAQAGVGDIYSSAAGNVEQAYQSAQQQAADQMARLGIEEAAAQTIPFTASQQAQALAGLEQGRAGGLSALQRYGASAQDFGSQMAQVAQQQGTEMNAALLNSLQRMLAESLGAEAQGAYDARLRAPSLARDLYEASRLGQPEPLSIEDQLAMDAAASRQAQASADYFVQIGRLRNETLQTLLDAGYDYEAARDEVNLMYPMPVM